MFILILFLQNVFFVLLLINYYLNYHKTASINTIIFISTYLYTYIVKKVSCISLSLSETIYSQPFLSCEFRKMYYIW